MRSADARGREMTRTNKSAPIVALYWLLKRLLTYWFISDVLPTLHESMGPKCQCPHPRRRAYFRR